MEAYNHSRRISTIHVIGGESGRQQVSYKHRSFIYNDHSNISIIAYSVARQVTKYKLLCSRSTIAINYIILCCTCRNIQCNYLYNDDIIMFVINPLLAD